MDHARTDKLFLPNDRISGIFWILTQYSVAGLHSIQQADVDWMLQPIPVSLSTWMMVEGATASQVSKIVC